MKRVIFNLKIISFFLMICFYMVRARGLENSKKFFVLIIHTSATCRLQSTRFFFFQVVSEVIGIHWVAITMYFMLGESSYLYCQEENLVFTLVEKLQVCQGENWPLPFSHKKSSMFPLSQTNQRNALILKPNFLKIEFQCKTRFVENRVWSNQT